MKQNNFNLRQTKEQKKRKIVKKIFDVFFIMLILFAVLFSIEGNRYFRLGSTLCGLQVSTMPIETATNKLKKVINQKDIAFNLEGKTIFEMSIEDLQPVIKTHGIKSLNKTDKMQYTLKERHIEFDFSEFKYQIKIRNIENEPKDAEIIFEDGKYSAIKEIKGKVIDYSKLRFLIAEQLFSSNLLKVNEIYINLEDIIIESKPKVTMEEILPIVEHRNEILNAKISYQLLDGNTYSIDNKYLINYIEDGKINVEEAVDDFLEMLQKKINDNTNQMEFAATEIGTISIPIQKCVKYYLINSNEKNYLNDSIQEGLQTKRNLELEVNPKFLNMKTYLEIDITRQKIFCYIDGKKTLDSNCITGTATKQFDTPTGIYFLDKKVNKTHLKGLKQDGNGYYNLYVEYWMPFYGAYGIHDAQWREDSEFNNEEYKTNGSSGCVNLKLQDAKYIYQEFPMDSPIIIYKS